MGQILQGSEHDYFCENTFMKALYEIKWFLLLMLCILLNKTICLHTFLEHCILNGECVLKQFPVWNSCLVLFL